MTDDLRLASIEHVLQQHLVDDARVQAQILANLEAMVASQARIEANQAADRATTERHSTRILALEQAPAVDPGLDTRLRAVEAAGGNTAKRAWTDVAKVGIGALGAWLAGGGKLPNGP